MAKYIDADRLRAEIEIIQNSLEHRDVRFDQVKQLRTDCMVEFCKMLNNVIDSLQQEPPIIEEDLVEKRKQECGYRRLLTNGIYQCERYEGVFVPCDGRCSWIVDYPKLKELKKMKKPDADLEKEIENYYYDNFAFISSAHTPTKDIVSDIATHFYELGLNARKEE